MLMLALILFIGKLMSSFVKLPERKFLKIFIELTSGLTLLIIIFSFSKSSFNTINLLFIVVILFYLFFKQKRGLIKYTKFNFCVKEYLVEIIWVFMLFLPIYLFKIIPIANNWNGSFPIGDLDYFYYSKLSDSLRLYGLENKTFDLKILHPDIFSGCVPYHYCELWLNAFIVWLLNLNSAKTLILITYPLLLLAVNIGFLSFFENRTKINLLIILFGFLLLFFEGIYLPLYAKYSYLNNHASWRVMSLTLMQYGKYSFPCLFFLSFLVEYFQGNRISAYIMLGSLIIVSVGILPGIAGGLILFILIDFFIRSMNNKERIFLLVYVLVILIFYYLFYFYNQTLYTSKYVSSSSILSNIILDPFNISYYNKILHVMLNILNLFFFRLLLFFVPFISLLIVLKIRYEIKFIYDYLLILILFGLFFICGSITSAIVEDLLDSLQIFTNLIPLFYILISVIFIEVIIYFNQSINKLIRITGLISLMFYLTINLRFVFNSSFNLFKEGNTYSIDYINSVKSEIAANKSLNIIGIILNESDYNHPDLPSYSLVLGYYPGMFIHYFSNNNLHVPINNYILYNKISDLPLYDQYYLTTSEQYEFIEKEKINNRFTNYEQSQINFIKQYGIKYIFVKKGALISNCLEKTIKKEIKDIRSGERLLIINS